MNLYQVIVEPFSSLPTFYAVALSLFLATLPLLDAHFNHSDQKPNLLSLSWLSIGVCSLVMVVLLSFSTTLQSQFTFTDVLGIQIVSMAVILVFHLGFLAWLGARKTRRNKNR